MKKLTTVQKKRNKYMNLMSNRDEFGTEGAIMGRK
jgi:hypothetical protein